MEFSYLPSVREKACSSHGCHESITLFVGPHPVANLCKKSAEELFHVLGEYLDVNLNPVDLSNLKFPLLDSDVKKEASDYIFSQLLKEGKLTSREDISYLIYLFFEFLHIKGVNQVHDSASKGPVA